MALTRRALICRSFASFGLESWLLSMLVCCKRWQDARKNEGITCLARSMDQNR
jgi:hypothetical protein